MIFVEEHALGTLQKDRQGDCVRERERLTEGKRWEGRAGICLGSEEILCSVFPLHPWRPALYVLPLRTSKDRQEETRWCEKERAAGRIAWNDLEKRVKRVEDQKIQKNRGYIAWMGQQKVQVY